MDSCSTMEARMDSGEPISYLALAKGTQVVAASGKKIGTVEHVLQVPELDLFDGIVVDTPSGRRFIDRDQISAMTTTTVQCTITDEEISDLPKPNGDLVLHLDAAYEDGPSLTARFARLFNRPHWRELE
jgi:hypothetical protein